MAALALGTICASSLQLAVLALAAWLAARVFHPTPEGRQLLWRLVGVLAFASPVLTWLVPAAPVIGDLSGGGTAIQTLGLRVVHSATATATAPVVLAVLAMDSVARIAWLIAS